MEKMQTRVSNTRKLVVTAMMAAVSTILMMLDFSIPIMPGFIKVDFSELPALITAFSLGPVWGVLVCLIKNVFNAMSSTTGMVGEISNFILGACFVFIAGFIYKKHKTQKRALIGSVIGAACMAVISVFSNYYFVYPVYTNFMSMDAIIGMYRAINPNIDNLFEALVVFNLPFTFVKGLLVAAITFLFYKKLSPVIKGK